MVGAVTTQVSQLGVLAAAAYPAAQAQVSQMAVDVAAGGVATTQVSQFAVLVAAMGRTQDPTVRAWTFTLDGHDFYVLRLGNTETLIYDVLTDAWYVWGSDSTALWRAFTGCNWQGANRIAATYGSNVIVGDDGNGALYFLYPDQSFDDDAISGSAAPRKFLREITGQVVTSSFDYVPCFGVQLLGTPGETSNALDYGVTLLLSDDRGHTYSQQDTLQMPAGGYVARCEWWSLGAFSAPGRLFKVQDYGALQTIKEMKMIEEPEKGS